MSNFFDFTTAEAATDYTPIPEGTVVPVVMTIKKGDYDEEGTGWAGWPTMSTKTGSVYLAIELTVTSGPCKGRKIWDMIGLRSEKGPTWGEMGRSRIRSILESARGIDPKAMGPEADAGRKIKGFDELDKIEFLITVQVEAGDKGPKNKIKNVVTSGSPAWQTATREGWQPTAAPMPANSYSNGDWRNAPPAPPPPLPAATTATAAPATQPAWRRK